MRAWLQEALAELQEDARSEVDSNARRQAEEPPALYQPDTFSRESLSALERMIHAQDCETVWKALERRADADALSSRQIAYEAGAEWARRESEEGEQRPYENTLLSHCLWCETRDETVALSGPSSSRYLGDMARNLAMVVAEIASSPLPLETVGKRRAKLREVELAAENLRKAIDPLWIGLGPLAMPHGSHGRPVDKFATSEIDKWLRCLRMIAPVNLDAASVAVAYQAGKQVARRPHGFLDALVAETRVWASERPELPRPNDANAARLLFIRKLTAYFREDYGKPLRACVLAIAGVFFDCSTLDESAINKLAP